MPRHCAIIWTEPPSGRQTGPVFHETGHRAEVQWRVGNTPANDRIYCDRLIHAREARGLTRRAAATALDIPLERLRAVERGEADITSSEVFAVCRVYAFPLGFYLRPPENAIDNPIFACGEGITRCARCSGVADFLCDWPVGRGKTCDLTLCRRCRVRVAGEADEDDDAGAIDYCPQHALAARSIPHQLPLDPVGAPHDR